MRGRKEGRKEEGKEGLGWKSDGSERGGEE